MSQTDNIRDIGCHKELFIDEAPIGVDEERAADDECSVPGP